MAAAVSLRGTDSRIVGEPVDLPDNGGLWPMTVVASALPHPEQPSAEVCHHRLVGVDEHFGAPSAAPGSQRDGLVQVEQRVIVVLPHGQPTDISPEFTDEHDRLSAKNVSVKPTDLCVISAAASAWLLKALAAAPSRYSTMPTSR